ncbi:putative outermembrane protein [Algibacter lectus]|uniref:Putative outermembrane protein n=1 Tax=Algibacter lectus TaxID=221126 RepID=A0A090WVL7_9FLAO|nr:putative outermembrane protein [Algibacter lectus]
MKSNLHLIVLFLSIINFSAFAQDTNAVKYTASSKGKFFVSWGGGNRDSFSKSDIHFEGDNYNFTIKDATARDKPKGWHLDYINPTRMTIPQTNFKMGYFISDKYSISLGLDHMKYVMENEKTRTLSGYIDLPTRKKGQNLTVYTTTRQPFYQKIF